MGSTRCIIHLDLDCYFVQAERHRNPKLHHQPVVIQQHDDLICISYEARKLGILKHSKPADIRTKYSDTVQIVHVPYSHGWKVSYQPYRLISHTIFQSIKSYCNTLYNNKQYNIVLERTSIDECYIDCTALIKLKLQTDSVTTTYYGCIYGQCKHDVPSIDVCKTDVDFTTLSESEKLLLLTSELAYNIRQHIYNKLHFTCGAGIAVNKLLAKQIGKYNKPNNQTILLQQHTQQLLQSMVIHQVPKFFVRLGKHGHSNWTKWLQSLGCDYASSVVSIQVSDQQDTDDNTNTDDNVELTPPIDKIPPVYYLSDLQKYPITELQAYFGYQTGLLLHDLGHGMDNTEVTLSTPPNKISVSMSLTPITEINKATETIKWLSQETIDRILEEIDINKRKATTLVFGYRLETQPTPTNISISFSKFNKLFMAQQYEQCIDAILQWIINDIFTQHIILHKDWSLRWACIQLTNFEPVATQTLSTMYNSASTLKSVNAPIQQPDHMIPLIVPSDQEKDFMSFVHSFNRDFFFKWRTLPNSKKHELYKWYRQRDGHTYTLPTSTTQFVTETHNILSDTCVNVHTSTDDNSTVIDELTDPDEFFNVKHTVDNTSAGKRKRELLVPTSIRKQPHANRVTLESFMSR